VESLGHILYILESFMRFYDMVVSDPIHRVAHGLIDLISFQNFIKHLQLSSFQCPIYSPSKVQLNIPPSSSYVQRTSNKVHFWVFPR